MNQFAKYLLKVPKNMVELRINIQDRVSKKCDVECDATLFVCCKQIRVHAYQKYNVTDDIDVEKVLKALKFDNLRQCRQRISDDKKEVYVTVY